MSSFFADLDQEEEILPKKNKVSSGFFLDLDEKKPAALKKPGKLAQFAIGNIERVAAPYDISVSPLASKSAQLVPYRENVLADIERLQEQKQMGLWDEQDQALYDNLINQIRNPKEAEKNVQTLDLSSANLIEKGAEKFGVNLKAETGGDVAARIAGNLISPAALAKAPNYIKTLAKKELRDAAKIKSQWSSLKTAAKGNPQKENILQFASEKGLNPEEATLLIQSNAEIDFLGKLANKSKKFRKIADGLKEKLGGSYDEIKEIGRGGGHLSFSEAEVLTEDLSKLLQDMGKTFVEGPDTKGARIAIEEAITKIQNNGGTIEDLINSRQNLGQIANWRNVDPKGAMLKKAQNAFMASIERKNPGLAKELKNTDEAYGTYKKFQSLLEKKQPVVTFNGVPIPDFMSNLAFFGALGYFTGAPPSVIGLATKQVVKSLSTKLLSNPKYQGIQKRLVSSVKTGSTNKQKEIFSAMKNILKKDDPELYDQVSGFAVD